MRGHRHRARAGAPHGLLELRRYIERARAAAIAPPPRRRADASSVVAGMAPALRRCYQAGLAKDRDTVGRLRITARIGADGRVAHLASHPPKPSPALARGYCVREAVVRGAQVAPPAGKRAQHHRDPDRTSRAGTRPGACPGTATLVPGPRHRLNTSHVGSRTRSDFGVPERVQAGPPPRAVHHDDPTPRARYSARLGEGPEAAARASRVGELRRGVLRVAPHQDHAPRARGPR